MLHSRISGVGKYLPPRVVKNQDLEKLMNTSDEWIQQRTGIGQRHWADPGMSTSTMACEAAKAALKDAGKTPDDIDAIVFATLSSDYVFPGCGVVLQKLLCPTRTIAALDVRNQCSGFLYGLQVADGWVRSGIYKCVLLVGSELHSTGLDQTPEGRDIGVLFGDGAGAVIVEPTTEKRGVLVTKLHSEGMHADKLWCEKPSSADFPRIKKGEQVKIDEAFFPQMDGRFVFKNAVVRMCEVLVEACNAIDVKVQDIDFLLAHQANLRINMMVMEQLGLPAEKTLNTLQKYGNTTAATLPIGMRDSLDEGLLKPNQLVAMVAFGSGFTWGATLMRW